MGIKTHGLRVGIERHQQHFFLSLKAIGTLTHHDYETITPMIDSALNGVKDPEVDVLIDGTELEGWELRAAWDDFKLGLKHGNKFRRIAIFGDKDWQEKIAKIANWFISGEVKYFDGIEPALSWLSQSDD